MILPVTALLGVRTLWLLRRSDVLVFLAGVGASIVQLVAMKRQGVLGMALSIDMKLIVTKFFGYFVFWSRALIDAEKTESFILGCLILIIIMIFSFFRRKWFDFGFVLLCACLDRAIFSVISRQLVGNIDPVVAGCVIFSFLLYCWCGY